MRSDKHVIVCNGAGYGNAGDEAQLASSVKFLSKFISEDNLYIFSPNVEFSKKYHGFKNFLIAPREFFFGSNSNKYIKYYSITNKKLSTILSIANILLQILFVAKCIFLTVIASLRLHKLQWISNKFSLFKLLNHLSKTDILYFFEGGI